MTKITWNNKSFAAYLVMRHMEDWNVKTATCYISPSFRVKLTRRFKPDVMRGGEDILMTVGRPNYVERRFVRLCVRAKEPFPVAKIQLTFWPKSYIREKK